MEITKIPADILRKKITLVPPEDIASGKHTHLFEQMHADMVANHGVGLAANQVGLDLAIFVIDKKLAQEEEVPHTYINPEITEYSDEEDEMEEGCLSIPQFYVPIRRAKKIWIKFTDTAGKKHKMKAKGFLARVLQHETDHLNGIVIQQRFSQQKK